MNDLNESTQAWAARLAPFKKANNSRSWFELAITLALFVALWVLGYALMQASIWLVVPVLLIAGGVMVRLFIIQHDCGHGAMFSSQKLNTWVGRCLGVLTMTPYEYWRRMHATHHAHSGNLQRRGVGDIDTLTIDEYLALGRWQRFCYRIYRNPLVMFVIGPIYLFLLRHRLPIGCMKQGRKPWISVLGTNVGIALLFAAMIYLVGWQAFLLIHISVIVLGGAIGVWMFYVQHQFDETHWSENKEWTHANAALHGSSYYDLPKPLMWLTGNIGIHHVHHLSSRIPFHKLPAVLDAHPELKSIGRLTFRESLKCIGLALWDSENRRLVPFSAAAAR